MKVPVLSSLILLLGLSSQLPAIERPKSLDANKPKERPAQAVGQPEGIPQVDQSAWLGVLSTQVSEILSLHLGLESGVVLSYVAPDSPASKAGLLEHDILTKVDGNAINSQDTLREQILTHEPGDEVMVDIIRKGKPEELKVTLGERPQNLPQAPQGQLIPRGRLGGLDLKRFEGLNGLPQGEQLEQHLEDQMKRLEEQLREMEQRGGLKLDLKWLDNLPKPEKGGIEFDFKSSSSFKFFDEDGSVEMKRSDGGREVIVRDKAGKLLFEGPWDTPQDKAGAPEKIRERIEQMNDGNQFHFRLENVPEPDLEIPGKKQPKLE